ncbi:unnamed protein product [Mycetohabitans rhizoxinica HKI 454]|uniref:Uncharacterized protein n=1 Tax=Mycetohabitans rhizoxinica (strain DSM 19002 / CIP 109453 / HKI 454) TaxID=882378 RepID=E5AKS6_MYCRK|nr:unnamed protein product [Mycetohabitans rhizoxinica HKI 454]
MVTTASRLWAYRALASVALLISSGDGYAAVTPFMIEPRYP